VVVASDFYEDIAALENAFGRLRYDQHDIIALQILDPIEIEFHDVNGILVDVETGETLQASASEIRASYQDRFQTFQRQLAEITGRCGGDYIALRTDRDPLAALSAYLAHREQLR
jgi:hypothetical protein